MFLDGIIEKYPSKLIENRNILEGNIIGCLWKQPSLFEDFKELNADDFITVDGVLYFRIAQELKKVNYKVFDEITLNTFFIDKPVLRETFNTKGGFKTIYHLMQLIDIENSEQFYDNLLKSNILLNLHNKGFDVIRELDKFNKMSSEQVYQYFDYQLNNIFVKRQLNVHTEDLIIDDAFLESCNDGEEMGVSFGLACPILSYTTSGIHRRSLFINAGFSGTGKTSMAIHSFVLPLIEQGIKVAIISNEQNLKEYQRLLLGTVLANRIHYYDMDRKKLQVGNFTEKDWEHIKKAQEYINGFKGSLKFSKLFDYEVSSVQKVIKKLSKEGFKYFIFDTFKSDNLASNQATGALVEDSKQLFQIADKEDVAIIMNMQLAIYMEKERYLSASCLSTAKGVKEVCSELILMRKIFEDEYTGEKKDLKPYKFIKGDDGKYTKTKQYITTTSDKKYMIVFIDKTRSGESDICLLYEIDLRYNRWREVGFCNPHHF